MKKISLIFLYILCCRGSIYAQVDLNNGLVAYYPFNGNVLDATGRGNNPTFNNSILTSDRNGSPNSACSFNGINQFIQIPNSDDFNQENSMTISYQFLTYSNTTQNIIGKIQYTGATGTQFSCGINFINSPGLYYGVNPSTGNCSGLSINTSQIYSNSQIPTNEWNCITVSFDRGIQKIYINGQLMQISITGFTKMLKCTNATVQIGTWWSGDPFWFNGILDEIRIYDRALNEDEVKALSPCSDVECSSWLKNDIISSAVRTGDIDVFGDKLTVEAEINWTEPSKFINDGGDIVSKHTTPSDVNYLLRPLKGSVTTTAKGYVTTGEVCDIEFNKTYHVAMVYDGSTLKYYRNGFLLSSVPCTGNLITNGNITTIGNYSSDPNNRLEDFYGYINNVRIWNVARTQSEIKQYMNIALPNPSAQTGLLANYIFDNLNNKQGNATFNGTLFGSAVVNASNPQCTFLADSCKTTIVTASFETADTICVDSPLVITNTSSGAATYNWSFCASDINTTPTGQDLGNPSSQLSTPVFMDFALNDDGNYYGLVVNYNSGNVIRLNYGNSLLNNPTATNLGNFGGAIRPSSEGIQIVKVDNKWIAIIVGGGNISGSNSSVAKMDFGNSLANTPTVTNWGNINNSLSFPHDIVISKEGNIFYGIVVNINNNTITRINFGTDFSSTPTGTNLGNIGGLDYPCGINYINSAGNNYVFITNRNNNTISRIDFGLSLTNTPTGINLGNPGNVLQRPRDISILECCGGITGLVVNEQNNAIVKLDFGSNITSIPSGASLGNIANFNFPHSISKLFIQQNDIYAFITNSTGNTLSRIRYQGCTLPGSTLQNPPPFVYTDPGTYNINLLVDIGLPTQASYCKQVVVIDCNTPCDTFKINAGKDTAICKGSSVTLGASGAVTYQWNASTYLSNVNIANPLANPPATTSFIVKGTDALGCVATDTVIVTVRNLPVVNAQPADTAICGSGSVQLSVTPATGGTYSWTPSTGLSNTNTANPVATVNATVEYFVTFTDANGCKNTDSVTITVNAIPTVSTRSDTTICNGAAVTLTTTGTGSTYTWTPSLGLNSTSSKSPIAKPSVTTKYIVTTTSSAGCTNKDSVTITILPLPDMSISGDTAICGNGAAAQLNASAPGAVSYSWSPTVGLNNPNIQNPLASPTVTTTYTVTVTGANGCKNTDSVLVQIFAQPVFSVSPPAAIVCAGKTVTLTASGGNNYTWSGDTTLTNINSPVTTATPNGNTTYSVIISESRCSAIDTLDVNVTVLPAPLAVASKSNDITCDAPQTQLSATGGNRYNWSPATGLDNPDIANPTATPGITTLYTVTVTGLSGCTATDTIRVFAAGGDASKTFFVPNAFSPNGDGLNDCISLLKWDNVILTEFAIFNKWGNKVFSATDIGQCWDGFYKGKQQPPDVYVYYIIAESPLCGSFNRKGTIVLIR